jgi:hypothetical protein
MSVLRVLAVVVLAALAGATDALAQTGQQKYTQWCQGCHGNPSNNKDGVLGGKDWNIIKLAMDTKPTMTADLRPAYNAGLLTDDDFMLIAGYLQTFGGGVTSQLAMPSAVSFGSVAVGVGSALVTRSVSSIGNAAVQLSSTVSSSNPLEFTIVSTTCTSGAFVLPGGTCSITLQFTPAATGTRSGQINVVSNGIGSPQSFAVSGTGGAGGGTGSLSVPASVSLGSQTVGVQRAGTTFSITNPTGTPVTVSSIVSSSASEFPIVGNTCSTVPGGSTCAITVAFRPIIVGSRVGSVTITSNGTGSPNVVSLTGTGVSAPAATKIPVVEYYNAGFGHYFMTADADEIAGLDAGAYGGAFVRTGRQFNAYSSPTTGTVPVCRFFTTPGTFGTRSSHFYTANPVECDGLKLNPAWVYEKIAFHIQVPVGGVCAVGTTPIYRMYNDGQTGAPNHRFSSDFQVYQDFTINKNWLPEGTGFCAPP